MSPTVLIICCIQVILTSTLTSTDAKPQQQQSLDDVMYYEGQQRDPATRYYGGQVPQRNTFSDNGQQNNFRNNQARDQNFGTIGTINNFGNNHPCAFNPCGYNADCNHQSTTRGSMVIAVCKCRSGYGGDPHRECYSNSNIGVGGWPGTGFGGGAGGAGFGRGNSDSYSPLRCNYNEDCDTYHEACTYNGRLEKRSILRIRRRSQQQQQEDSTSNIEGHQETTSSSLRDERTILRVRRRAQQQPQQETTPSSLRGTFWDCRQGTCTQSGRCDFSPGHEGRRTYTAQDP